MGKDRHLDTTELRRWLGAAIQSALTIVAATAMGVFYAALFAMSVAVLWGWYFIGLFTWFVFLARVIDERSHFREELQRPPYSTRARRAFTLYVLILFGVSSAVNALFSATYLLGVYRPPFGEVPFTPRVKAAYETVAVCWRGPRAYDQKDLEL